MSIRVLTDAAHKRVRVESRAKNWIFIEDAQTVLPNGNAISGIGIQSLTFLVGHHHTLCDRIGNKALPAHKDDGQQDENLAILDQPQNKEAH